MRLWYGIEDNYGNMRISCSGSKFKSLITAFCGTRWFTATLSV